VESGDIVRVIRVPAASSDSAGSQVLVDAAEVTASQGALSDSKTNANTTLNVTVLVPTGKSTTVAAAAAAKTLVLVKLSAGTRPDVSRSNGDG
jgi:transcriptional regulator of nitric oxide reductase